MRIRSLDLRGFRSHDHVSIELAEQLTVIVGPNGSGKTGILEGLHFALTGRSCRTSMDRQMISWDSETTLVSVAWEDCGAEHELRNALSSSGQKQVKLDGNSLDDSVPASERPSVIVFLPDRLALINGSPGERRRHFDTLVAALRPGYAGLRNDYNRSLVQRNTLLSRIRSRGTGEGELSAWNSRLAEVGSTVVRERSRIVDSLAGPLVEISSSLGLTGGALELRHRSSGSPEPDLFNEELAARLEMDLDRGFTTYGPHRADFVFRREGHELRSSASQGEKRISLLALLLAEREIIAGATGNTPLLLLDDVMSELDAHRRGLLVEMAVRTGQCVVTATESSHVPSDRVTGVAEIDLGTDTTLREAA